MLALVNFLVNDFLQTLDFLPHLSSMLLDLVDINLDSLQFGMIFSN